MERLIYIGTVVEEGYGTPPDYEIGDLYKMNRFIRYLIQDIDDIRKKLLKNFPTDKVANFVAKIENFDEFECAYFRNLDIDRFEDNNHDFIFDLNSSELTLKQTDLELVFKLPLDCNVENSLSIDEEEMDFSDLNQYDEMEVQFYNDDDFPHIFMTAEQIAANFINLSGEIDDLLSDFNLNSNSSKDEIGSILGIDFIN
jgi:hypothetical protein